MRDFRGAFREDALAHGSGIRRVILRVMKKLSWKRTEQLHRVSRAVVATPQVLHDDCNAQWRVGDRWP